MLGAEFGVFIVKIIGISTTYSHSHHRICVRIVNHIDDSFKEYHIQEDKIKTLRE